ncbi:hypothetical protein VP395_07000 [Mariniflexile soesokkakense]|uniref:Uncharacterized protein n=1 Tax=Mariniflexile soesokkakense TaxID=1343160 RepID=A0ABV0AC62_9FLAO
MEIEKDIQNIIDYSHKFAEKMLNNAKEYYPFGAKINNNGELIAVGYKDNESDFPESQKVIDELTAEFERELNIGEIKAYGLTYDVRVQTDSLKDKTDAILIDIYHRNSNEIPKYYFTYSWNKNNELIFGESFGMKK